MPWSEAIVIAGSRERLIEGVTYSTWKGWENKTVPSHHLSKFLLERFRADARVIPTQSSTSEPDKPWLHPDVQKGRIFTAMVLALRRLEDLYPLGSTSPNAWRARVGWEAMMAGAQVLLAVAGWTEKDWRDLHQGREDQWRRPKKGARPEAETIRQRLQIPFSFEERLRENGGD